MTDRIRYLDVVEFRREGYLQELNRMFLHPLGLALEVVVDEHGDERLGGIWDYRSDPEGIRYERVNLQPKAECIRQLWEERKPVRTDALGWMVQPEDE